MSIRFTGSLMGDLTVGQLLRGKTYPKLISSYRPAYHRPDSAQRVLPNIWNQISVNGFPTKVIKCSVY